MAKIKVKLKDGTCTSYTKPDHCPIPDEEWCTAMGYCWGFALDQDEGRETCKAPSEDCYNL